MAENLRAPHRKFGFLVSGGFRSREEQKEFARDFIRAAGMTPARKPRIDPYPYRGGGDHGSTGFYPLMESYLMIDEYSRVGEVEIWLSTCKPERLNLDRMRNLIRCRVGEIVATGEFVLEVPAS